MAQPVIIYSRQDLLDLAPLSKWAGTRHDIPAELLQRRRRGTQAGVKRNRRKRERKYGGELLNWPYLSVTMGKCSHLDQQNGATGDPRQEPVCVLGEQPHVFLRDEAEGLHPGQYHRHQLPDDY